MTWANADPGAVLVEHSPVLTASFDLVGPGASGGFRLYPDLNGPRAATGFSGPICLALSFTVSSPGFSLDGYWWWCCLSGQSSSAPAFALWRAASPLSGVLLPAGNATGNPLTVASWNFTPVATPVPLTAGTAYKAVVGMNDSFPFTAGWYSLTGPGWNGVVNGSLIGYSGPGAGNPQPFG
jgi:hypothetical protein